MKSRIALILSLILLTGCTSAASDSPAESSKTSVGTVPAQCEIPGVIQAFSDQVPNSQYVPTDWQPSPDTDLEAALTNDGIACTYGIQEAEVGGTILWASNARNVWDARIVSWIEAGETEIDLPGIDESSAYILQDGTAADEMHVWRVNLLIDGVWIQVGASFLQNLEEALPIVKEAIAATVSKS